MSLSLSKIETLLTGAGLQPLVEWILVHDQGEIEFPFQDRRSARRAMRVLYQWLAFHPQLKETTTLSNPPQESTLIIRRGRREKRGRRGG